MLAQALRVIGARIERTDSFCERLGRRLIEEHSGLAFYYRLACSATTIGNRWSARGGCFDWNQTQVFFSGENGCTRAAHQFVDTSIAHPAEHGCCGAGGAFA